MAKSKKKEVKTMTLPSDRDSSGRNLGQEEIELLTQVIKSGTLNCTGGTMVKQFEQEFAEVYGAKHCITSTSVAL